MTPKIIDKEALRAMFEAAVLKTAPEGTFDLTLADGKYTNRATKILWLGFSMAAAEILGEQG